MKAIPIPADLFEAIGAYLLERSYREVVNLVAGMQRAAQDARAAAPTEPAA